MVDLPKLTTQNIAFKLKPKAEILVKKGHPWVFDQSITKQNKEGNAGDLAIIFDNKTNKFLAAGLYDPFSPIRIKILQANTPIKFNKEWIKDRINKAYNFRIPLFETNTNSYRLIYGENDGLPSLIADVYDDVLVLKLYSQIWFPYLNDLISILQETSKAKTIVLRLSRNVQKVKNDLGLFDGQILFGELEHEVVIFKEHGINFSANVIHGHKTGYFLDHRHNRKQVGDLATDKSVLDVFSYAGGFSTHTIAKGAKEVTSLDISEQALKVAEENVKLNPHTGKHITIAGDAFEKMDELIEEGKSYDIVVIDPPSFAKSKDEVEGALKNYKKLTLLGLKLVAKKGLLVLASCSSRITSDDFFHLVESTLTEAKAEYKIIDETLHDIDHPIGFKEGAYLKCVYVRIK